MEGPLEEGATNDELSERPLKRQHTDNLILSNEPKESGQQESDSNSSTPTSPKSPLDPSEPTYSDMIEHAIRELGGASVVEITNFIEKRYSQVLSNKTSTWRNSVAGCLSANRRKLFVKEPVRKNSKRYIWKLRSDVETTNGESEDTTNFADAEDSNEDDEVEEQQTTLSTTKPPLVVPVPATPTEQPLGKGSVQLVKLAMQEMGGLGTDDEVTEWIATTKRDFGVDKKKLGIIVHAVFASQQYSHYFAKERVDHSNRITWKLVV